MKVRFFGSLSNLKEINIKIDNGKDLISILKENEILSKYLLSGNKIRADVLLLINGVDYKLLGGVRAKLNDNDEIDIIPINHGG